MQKFTASKDIMNVNYTSPAYVLLQSLHIDLHHFREMIAIKYKPKTPLRDHDVVHKENSLKTKAYNSPQQKAFKITSRLGHQEVERRQP
jgi:hypothetical protein